MKEKGPNDSKLHSTEWDDIDYTGLSWQGFDKKRTYMKEAGYLLYSDIGHIFLEEAESIIPTKARPTNDHSFSQKIPETQLNVAVAALSIFKDVEACSRLSPERDKKLSRMHRKYHITPDEQRRIPSNVFNEGLDDLDFTFHFAPAVAVDVADAFLRSNAISQEQYDRLTLSDFADMIGSGWYSDLMHDMALTRNGVYGTYGKEANQYKIGVLESTLERTCEIPLDQHIFDINEQLEDDGFTYLTAVLAKQVRKKLRSEMSRRNVGGRVEDSVGCPVARRTGAVAIGLAQGKRVKSLVDRSYLQVGGITQSSKVRLHQNYTAIDHALDVSAMLLDRYDSLHGTPATGGDPWQFHNISHERRQKVDCFRRPTVT